MVVLLWQRTRIQTRNVSGCFYLLHWLVTAYCYVVASLHSVFRVFESQASYLISVSALFAMHCPA